MNEQHAQTRPNHKFQALPISKQLRWNFFVCTLFPRRKRNSCALISHFICEASFLGLWSWPRTGRRPAHTESAKLANRLQWGFHKRPNVLINVRVNEPVVSYGNPILSNNSIEIGTTVCIVYGLRCECCVCVCLIPFQTLFIGLSFYLFFHAVATWKLCKTAWGTDYIKVRPDLSVFLFFSFPCSRPFHFLALTFSLSFSQIHVYRCCHIQPWLGRSKHAFLSPSYICWSYLINFGSVILSFWNDVPSTHTFSNFDYIIR